MNWLVLIIAFAIAVGIGAFLATMLGRTRRDWSDRRRLWTAALALPAFILFATVSAVGCTMAAAPVQGDGNRNLVVAVYGMVGAIFLVITLAGGFVGAVVAVRKDEE